MTQGMRMARRALRYTLPHKEERVRSTADLEELFFALVSAFEPQLFVEAGAKDAASSLRARGALPDARVVAFEANPHTHRRFARKHAYASMHVEYLHLALSDQAGTARFFVRTAPDGKPSADGQASLFTQLNDDKHHEVSVPATTLETFFGDHPFDRCALWIDVEGANRLVLEGGRSLLSRASVVMIEVEDRPKWSDQWLVADTERFLRQHGLVPVGRDFQARHQYNLIFVRDRLLKHQACQQRLAEFERRGSIGLGQYARNFLKNVRWMLGLSEHTVPRGR